MRIALTLIFAAVACRLLATVDMGLANFAPLTAVSFCSAVYFRDKRMWLAPFAALCLSDLYINWFYVREYGFHFEVGGAVARAASYAVGLLLGVWISRRKSWLGLLNGSLLGAVVFYLITNTQSWAGDAFYAKTLAGWWQALTVGHPEYPPTITFFHKTLWGDLMFTGLFAGIMEWVAHTKKEPSLLDTEGDEEEETDGKPVEAEVKE